MLQRHVLPSLYIQLHVPRRCACLACRRSNATPSTSTVVPVEPACMSMHIDQPGGVASLSLSLGTSVSVGEWLGNRRAHGMLLLPFLQVAIIRRAAAAGAITSHRARAQLLCQLTQASRAELAAPPGLRLQAGAHGARGLAWPLPRPLPPMARGQSCMHS